MKHEVLKNVIYDQHMLIRNADIVPRAYTFDPNANYVLTGVRRAGKSTLLYSICRKFISDGMGWNRIIYINFEDERLTEFKTADFNDIVSIQAELSAEKGIYFFDEIQNIPGWEKFARRLADAGEHVYITGSNAKMLSSEIASTLGGRYLTKHITTYSFAEYLDALKVPRTAEAFYTTRTDAEFRKAFENYYTDGGFPEALRYRFKKEYVSGVYQKVLLGDIVTRNKLRNESAAKILIKKIAESVKSDISYTKLHNILKTIGIGISKDSVIDYVGYAMDAYLIFPVQNFFAKFADKESTPKYYFTDNGLLNLFLTNKNTLLLENIVAVELVRQHPDGIYYLKSSQTGIDVDFYLEEENTAVQVAYSIEGDAVEREVGNLIKLARSFDAANRFLIITKEEEAIIEKDGVKIEVIPAYKYLMNYGEKKESCDKK